MVNTRRKQERCARIEFTTIESVWIGVNGYFIERRNVLLFILLEFIRETFVLDQSGCDVMTDVSDVMCKSTGKEMGLPS